MSKSSGVTTAPYAVVSHQIERYLMRLRRTAPLPCSAEECYFGLFPPTFRQWVNVSGLEDIANVKVSNVVLTIHRAVSNEPVHVQLGDDSDEVFWIAAMGGWPIPVNSARQPLLMNKAHPHYTALKPWLETAYAIESNIDDAMAVARRLDKVGPSTELIRRIWPELLNFVRAPMRGRSVIRGPTPVAVKEKINTMLATAVMLPETLAPLRAWVGFHTGKEV